MSLPPPTYPEPDRDDPDDAAPGGANPIGASGPSPALEPGLYVVSTPIGNLRDITLRALDVLRGADFVAAEDTRVARKLLDAYGIKARLIAYHEHNAAQARPRLIGLLAAGRRVALISDAGTPLISDPGFKLVEEALDAGARVIPAPGPSALLAALVAAGLPTDRFLFAGFPPAKAGARARWLQALAAAPATLVFYEGPSRLQESLIAMAAAFGPRRAAVARELTKRFEEVRRGDLAELAALYDTPPRGEVVVVVAGPGPAAAPAEAELDAVLRAALAKGGVKEAAAEAAAALGVPRKAAYARALILRDEAD